MHYKILYDDARCGETKSYCLSPLDLATAMVYAHKCHGLYVGKPYPNGKGWYEISNVRVVPFN